MINLIRMIIAAMLLRAFFFIDDTLGEHLTDALYIRVWPLYDWLFGAATMISPLDIPPIYEDINSERTNSNT